MSRATDVLASSTHSVRLQPRAPLIVRDARPFSADPGARAVSLDWPLPQTIAGAIRTQIGDTLGFNWSGDGPARARRISVHGPLAAVQRTAAGEWEIYVPAPRDALAYTAADQGKHCKALRPVRPDMDGAGTNLPRGLLPLAIETEAKPDASGVYWSVVDAVSWLVDPTPNRVPTEPLGHVPHEVRVHVGIDHGRMVAEEGALFSTDGLAFADAAIARAGGSLSLQQMPTPACGILCRVTNAPPEWTPTPVLFPMGGERRLTALEPGPDWPAVPDALAQVLASASKLRLQLVTPALFGAGGWHPDWLDSSTWRGSPPGLPDLTLRLVSAAVGRRVPVSGWDLERKQARAVRFAAPSGSVYFFEVVEGTLSASQVARLWLQPVGSDEQDARDGFGLVLPGIW